MVSATHKGVSKVMGYRDGVGMFGMCSLFQHQTDHKFKTFIPATEPPDPRRVSEGVSEGVLQGSLKGF